MTLTQKLMRTLAATLLVAWLGAGVAMAADEAEKLVLDGSTTVGPIAKAFAEYYMSNHPDVNVTVNESGSGNGAKSLINSACDIANMSRFMKDSEFAAAVEKGVKPVAHVVAMDGLPVLVHPSNPVKELSLEQVRKIYTGEIANWSEAGGPDQAIVIVSRDTNSGTYETFHELVMTHKVNGESVKEKITDGAEYVGSNGAVRARVQSTPAAIGYAGLGFVDKTVKALEIDGVYPTPETVTSGKYAIARPLFMFTNGYPKLGSHTYQFVTLHLTEKGQEIIEDIGFVPVTKY
ncbi:phosphate ABC transporter substrate-binding protein [Candidatus Sumerlaeota bacterium]|nr:phosphate ABC transporter substrate-binding protein [Candidatus Sumerlaeota bacterium]